MHFAKSAEVFIQKMLPASSAYGRAQAHRKFSRNHKIPAFVFVHLEVEEDEEMVTTKVR